MIQTIGWRWVESSDNVGYHGRSEKFNSVSFSYGTQNTHVGVSHAYIDSRTSIFQLASLILLTIRSHKSLDSNCDVLFGDGQKKNYE